MSPRFVLRDATAEDLAAVAAAEAEIYTREGSWTAEDYAEVLAGEEGPCCFLVAETETGELAGYALASYNGHAGWVYVSAITTLVAYRRCGLARAMLARLLAWGETLGVSRARLHVRADNAPAISLYAQHGFRELYRREGFYLDGGDADAVSMLLEVDQTEWTQRAGQDAPMTLREAAHG